MSIGSTQLGLNCVDVALMIGIDQVARRVALRRADREGAKNFKRSAIQDKNDGSSRNVQEPLSRVRRECHGPGLKRVLAVDADELLGNEFPLRSEHLDAFVSAIGDIRKPIVGELYVVRHGKLLKDRPDSAHHGTQFIRLRLGGYRALVQIQRLVAIRSPHALEHSCVRVKHHHAAVAVAVRDEHFVRLAIDAYARRSPEDFGSVAAGLAALADGHHKLAFLGELEDLVVIRKARWIVSGAIRISKDPHEALVIHSDAMLVRWPLISRPALSAPALDEVALVVEFHDGRRRYGYQVRRG